MIDCVQLVSQKKIIEEELILRDLNMHAEMIVILLRRIFQYIDKWSEISSIIDT